MIIRKKYIVIAFCIGASIVGAFILRFALMSHGGTNGRLYTEYYEKIRIGMTDLEVQDLLGGPPGNYSDFKPEPIWGPPKQRNGVRKYWAGDHYIFYIWFENGLVTDKADFVASRNPKSFYDWIQDLFNLSN
jgi:hypothetical protein